MLLGSAAKDAMLSGLANHLESSASVVIDIYAGNEVLVQLIMPSNIVKSVQNGAITLNVAEQALIAITGVPNKAKIMTDGILAIELTVGTDLLLDDTTIYKGGYFKITELSISI